MQTATPWIAGQDAAGSHADMPPFVMDMVVGQLGCAGHVQPLQPTLDTQAALIEMDDRGGEELLLDVRPTRLSAGAPVDGCL